MSLTKTQFLILCLAVLALSIVCYVLQLFYDSDDLPSISFVLLLLSILLPEYFLYRYGRLRYTPWRFPLFAVLGATVVCTLAIVQHLEYSRTLLCFFLSAIPVLYLLYFFITKHAGEPNDWLKLAWVLLNYGSGALIIMGLLTPTLWLSCGLLAMLYVVLIHFWWADRKKPTYSPDAAAEDEGGHWDFERGEFDAGL